jgi:hypothetical protein
MRCIGKRVVFLTLVLLLAAVPSAGAHGHTEVGNYTLVIGFRNEPAYQGEVNGLDLFVTNKTTGAPVNGLEQTLQAEIIYGASTRALNLRPQYGQEGAYTADIIPTEAGDYTWHIFGAIEDTPVDVRMTSAPDTFSSVQSRAESLFPGDPSASGQSGGETAARTALLVGGAGLVFGLLGLVFGVLGYLTARRRV